MSQVNELVNTKLNVIVSLLDYQFVRKSTGLVIGSNTITIGPVPLGVNGSNTNHYIYIRDGANSEVCLITGGTAVSDSATGTITFTCVNTHVSGNYTIESATAGLREGQFDLGTSGVGGRIYCPPGDFFIQAPEIGIGNGSGTTDSTIQNISIIGAGAGADEYLTPNKAATNFIYEGSSGGTMIKIYGPIRRLLLTDFRLDGNDLVSYNLDIYAMSLSTVERLTLVGLEVAGCNIRINAGAGFNANSDRNRFSDLSMRAISDDSGCVIIGDTPINFNAGNFGNKFYNCKMIYANNSVDSVGVTLAWADNNKFDGCQIQPDEIPGAGYYLEHIKQSGDDYKFMPSEHVFADCQLGHPLSLGIKGDAGEGVGTVFWGYQVADSSGLDLSIKNIRGWLHNGDFFDSSKRMAFRSSLNIYERDALAIHRVLGFIGNGTGKITTIGTAVTGSSGTLFTSELAVGKMIGYNGNEFRIVTAIADNTHLTIDSGFTDDITVAASYLVQTGSNSFLFSDGHTNIGSRDLTELRFWSNGIIRGRFDIEGNFKAVNGIYPSSTVAQIRSGTGTPESNVTGQIGDIWMRTNGGASTTLYIKESGAGTNTGWVAK